MHMIILESYIKSVVQESLNILLNERHVLKIPHQESPMDGGIPPMDNNMPPMDEQPPMDDNMPPMDEQPPMDDNMPPMDEEPPMDGDEDNAGGDTQEIDDLFNKMDIEDKNAVIKYAKSMVDDDSNDEQEEMPMESMGYLGKRIDEICGEVLSKRIDKEERRKKDIAFDRRKMKGSPFVRK